MVPVLPPVELEAVVVLTVEVDFTVVVAEEVVFAVDVETVDTGGVDPPAAGQTGGPGWV